MKNNKPMNAMLHNEEQLMNAILFFFFIKERIAFIFKFSLPSDSGSQKNTSFKRFNGRLNYVFDKQSKSELSSNGSYQKRNF